MKGVSLRQIFLAVVVAGMLYAGAAMVLGVQGATKINVGPTDRFNSTATSSQSTSAEAGNVTELNISGQGVTSHWAGFYGEVTGNLTLGNSDGEVFYDWVGLGTATGEVFASNTSSVDWSGIGCASEAEIAVLNGDLGINVGTDPDGVEETYATTTAHPSFSVGAISGITGCNSTNAYTSSASGDDWFQILLMDATGNPVYTTIMNDTTTGFDGVSHDFQLLVGESDTAGSSTLYFFIEIG